jgi:glycyl-tRNA synthetase beta chain
MEKLLLEIGAEEIPAGYIAPALKALSTNLKKKLTAARIAHGEVSVYGTPRHLAVMIDDVAVRQKTMTTEVLGPPEKVAYDDAGNPTVAIQKFAEKVGMDVSSLKVKKTEKGSYVCVKVVERGLATRTILKQMLPEAILSIPFPKTMKWGELNITFARPIHSILALLGSKVVPFQLGNIKSGRTTFGHSFMHPSKIRITEPGEYIDKLKSVHVLVDMAVRKKETAREIEAAAAGVSGNILPDEELLDIVTNLVEYPVATAGRFDDAFLDIPREILIMAMREHQKYFAVVDGAGNLMPYFVAVNNTRTKDLSLVAKGHERVLRARLADAQFFYQSDVKALFEPWNERLQGVLFQATLGTMAEKIQRVMKIGAHVAALVSTDSAFHERVVRAAGLCKADLVSQVVVEFPKLQGIMGRVYAALSKEPADVASAIEEHYRPTYSGGPLPETLTGAVLAIADKIDSICGCFSVGLVPTGASDPYALRRQGIGIINIMLDQGLSIPLKDMIVKSLALFSEKSQKDVSETAENVLTFLKNRVSRQLVEEGSSKDVIAAVVNAGVDTVPEVWSRVNALERLKGAPDFEPLAVSFKRVVNIIRKAEGFEGAVVDEQLFEHPSESELLAAFKNVRHRALALLEKGRFEEGLLEIASLRDRVDAFFDGVLVMAEDKGVRHNRLALLGIIAELFDKFADFSKLSAS